MTGRWIYSGLLLAAIAAGALSEPSRELTPLMVSGYQVLAADFHVHIHPWS